MATFEQLVDYKQDDLYPFIGTRSFEKLSASGDITETAKDELYRFLQNFFPRTNFICNDTTKTFGIDSAGKDDKGDAISSKYPIGIVISPGTGVVTSRNDNIEISFKFAAEKAQQADTDHITITKVPQACYADAANTANTATTANSAATANSANTATRATTADKATTADSATTAGTAVGVSKSQITGSGNRFLYIDNDNNFAGFSPLSNKPSIFGIDNSGNPTRYELITDDDGNVSLGGGGGKSISATAADAGGTVYRILGINSNLISGSSVLELAEVVYSNGSPYFKGTNLYQTSDETLKTFTEDLDINLDSLSKIKKGLFYWNNDSSKTLDLGITAQSVEQLFPQIVDNTDGVKCVSYSKLSVVALAAIDKLNEKIKELEAEIKDLKEYRQKSH